MALDAAGGAEFADLLIVEDSGADEETEAFGVVEGEHAAAAWDNIECELGVLPVFELAAAHIEGFAIDFAELDVGVPDEELAPWITHGGATVAAASGLMKHKQSMFFAEDTDEVNCEIGGENLGGKLGHIGTPT